MGDTQISQPNWRYTSALTLLNQAEASTWARLTGFLTMSGFLFAAWGVTVSAKECSPWIRAALALTGLALSLVYAGVMQRSREFVRCYVKYAKGLENNDGPLTHGEQEEVAFSVEQRFGSALVAPLIPRLIGFAFLVLVGFALEPLIC
jgi:hypothetical protein